MTDEIERLRFRLEMYELSDIGMMEKQLEERRIACNAALEELAECKRERERERDQHKGAVDSYMKAYDDCRAAHTETHANLVRAEEELTNLRAELEAVKRENDDLISAVVKNSVDAVKEIDALCQKCENWKVEAENYRAKYRGLIAKLDAQLAELNAISEALGTNEGHSSVYWIEQLRAELEAVKRTWLSPEELAACNAEIERLRKIESAAVWVCDSPQWRGDDFDNCLYALDAALKGEK